MKIKFEIRTTKKVKEGEMVPLYVRMVDGRAFHQAVKTRTLVNPNMWDEKGECIKSRVLCTPEERERIDKDVNDLRSYLLETYNEAKNALQHNHHDKVHQPDRLQDQSGCRMSCNLLPHR